MANFIKLTHIDSGEVAMPNMDKVFEIFANSKGGSTISYGISEPDLTVSETMEEIMELVSCQKK
jgi:hypothetical protein